MHSYELLLYEEYTYFLIFNIIISDGLGFPYNLSAYTNAGAEENTIEFSDGILLIDIYILNTTIILIIIS